MALQFRSLSLLLCAAAVLSSLANREFSSGNLRCGFDGSELPAQRLQGANRNEMLLEKDELLENRAAAPLPAYFEIPIVFHIITDDSQELGNVPVDSLLLTMDSANEVFQGYNTRGLPKVDSNIRVVLAGITYTANTEWFLHCGTYENQKAIKSFLNHSPTHYVNVYVCKTGNLGWTSNLPAEMRDFSSWNGIFVHFRSFPSSLEDPAYENMPEFAEGDTFTHELGHFVGLLHTFGNGQNGCDNDDRVLDTPVQKFASGGLSCLQDPPWDTCPDLPGLDPVWNMMDYSDDFCAQDFTVGQTDRMKSQMQIYKPSLYTRSYPFPCVSTGNAGPASRNTLCITPCERDPKFNLKTCFTNKFNSSEWGECACNSPEGFPTQLMCSKKLEREERWMDISSGLCVSAMKQNLELVPCLESTFQRWAFGSDGRINNVGSGWCVTGTADNVFLEPCSLDKGNQQWSYPYHTSTGVLNNQRLSLLRVPNLCLEVRDKTLVMASPCTPVAATWNRRSKPSCKSFKNKKQCVNQSPSKFGCTCSWVKRKCI